MTTRSPSPERLDDILVEDSYADYEQQPSPRGPEEAGDGEASSAFQALTSQPDASIPQQASGSAGAPKPVRQRIPVGPMEDFKSAPKRQPVPVSGQASAATARSQPQAEPSQAHALQQMPQQQQQSSGATRYFLLKSVSIDNIEKSVAEGVWATQVCLTAC